MTDVIYSSRLEVSEDVFNKIIFSNKETKDKFLISERKFCHQEVVDRYAAMGKNELREAHLKLREKEVKHAIFKGYKPVTKNSKEWYYSPEVVEPILA